MFKRSLLVGAILFASSTVMAAEVTQTDQFRVISIQGGQGPAVTVMVPVASIEAPYALTGSQPAATPVQWVPMQFGQGLNMVWVAR